ncbi:ABC transporter substrate-binding protein [Humidisolicoccus flavus]|uniref:ABC transporter substrate-binding protein n=1 Tax=Humidisolicoccus flavus TaxID=3111414 RepID=UPI003244E468
MPALLSPIVSTRPSSSMPRRRSLTGLALLAGLSLALTACSSPASDDTPAATSSATQSETAASGLLENCGFSVASGDAPERVVTIKSSTTEALIALGLGDRIVGVAFQDGPVPESLGTIPELNVIDPKMPGAEAVLGLEPDFIFAGWESAFAADAIGTRQELADLGVRSYVWPAACMTEGSVPESVSFDDIGAAITEVAELFDVDAASVLADQAAALDSVTVNDDGLSALWWSSGTDTPYVGAGGGAPELMMETVGLRNIASELPGGWSPYGWESVIAANPDVLVLVDSDWNSAANKIAYLTADPVLSQLEAVKAGKFLIVPFAASEAGVRTASATATMSEDLAELVALADES